MGFQNDYKSLLLLFFSKLILAREDTFDGRKKTISWVNQNPDGVRRFLKKYYLLNNLNLVGDKWIYFDGNFIFLKTLK